MTLSERLPSLDRDELLNLRANAQRLESQSGKRQEEASALLPLIDAELAERARREPPKARPPRRAAAK